MLHQLTAMREAVLHTIFLDLQKAHDALDWYRCFKILMVYGVGPWTLWLFLRYWDWLQMVAKACRYFVLPFQGYRGVTQGNPLSPKVFNLVVDAVIWHWVGVVALTEAGVEGVRETIQELAEFLYADGGLFALPHKERLQRAFNFLTDLFERVDNCTNMRKTVIMTC